MQGRRRLCVRDGLVHSRAPIHPRALAGVACEHVLLLSLPCVCAFVCVTVCACVCACVRVCARVCAGSGMLVTRSIFWAALQAGPLSPSSMLLSLDPTRGTGLHCEIGSTDNTVSAILQWLSGL